MCVRAQAVCVLCVRTCFATVTMAVVARQRWQWQWQWQQVVTPAEWQESPTLRCRAIRSAQVPTLPLVPLESAVLALPTEDQPSHRSTHTKKHTTQSLFVEFEKLSHLSFRRLRRSAMRLRWCLTHVTQFPLRSSSVYKAPDSLRTRENVNTAMQADAHTTRTPAGWLARGSPPPHDIPAPCDLPGACTTRRFHTSKQTHQRQPKRPQARRQ